MLTGSPPHTRGTLIHQSCHQLTYRITPAYAGNTYRSKFEDRRGGDHPRIRGEHPIRKSVYQSPLGSPPHTRGTLQQLIAFSISSRITPAYAGNTLGPFAILETRRDHPRIRGEHASALVVFLIHLGSPPHTRGTLTLS